VPRVRRPTRRATCPAMTQASLLVRFAACRLPTQRAGVANESRGFSESPRGVPRLHGSTGALETDRPNATNCRGSQSLYEIVPRARLCEDALKSFPVMLYGNSNLNLHPFPPSYLLLYLQRYSGALKMLVISSGGGRTSKIVPSNALRYSNLNLHPFSPSYLFPLSLRIFKSP
jgi:hypothetical protein